MGGCCLQCMMLGDAQTAAKVDKALLQQHASKPPAVRYSKCSCMLTAA
jgi:hypothetical protein